MRLSRLAPLLVVATLAAACGGTEGATHDPTPTVTTAPAPTSAAASPSTSPVQATKKLDSIVVLGHSGTTGYGSDPSRPDADVLENSWATGTNPAVHSIYQRLLATHPALKGHSTSLGIDGSTVDDLPGEVDDMLGLDPLPDVVIIQTIDNDMQCDGTDAANEKRFGHTLDQVLDTIYRQDEYAQVFFVDQWASVQTYTEATKDLPSSVEEASGTGPCDTFTEAGKVRPAGVASTQRIVDGYFHQIQTVCAAHKNCWTDSGALQTMPLRDGDLTVDANHLSVKGLPVMAQYAWDALPDAIKNRA